MDSLPFLLPGDFLEESGESTPSPSARATASLAFSGIWLVLFLFALAQGFFYSHVKLALSYRLNHPGVVYCFLCASAFFSLLQHGSDLIWDQGPGLFALLPFLTLFSSGLTLVLDWVRLSGEVADKEHAVDSVLAAYSDAQTFLNTLVYGICFTAVALAAGEWLSGIFFANVFTTVVLGFCSYHTIHLYGRSRTMKHQFSTDSFRFRHISLLLLLTIVVLLLMSMVSALSIRFRLPLPAYHLLVSSFQLVYFFLTVSVVSYANSLKFDLPDDPKELDTAFLDSVLKARGTLAPANTLVKAVRFPLVEGCHFRVSRFSLQYADPDTAGSQKAPHAVVVKILAWAKPLHERLLLNLSNSITRADPSERNAMYLKSYQVEARFYRNYAKHARGFRIPRVYLNLDDSVRCKFGLIMQEVFISSDGVASGFNFQESRFVLKKLARYHGTNWEHPKMDKMNVWRQAGYWAGAKRRNDKRAVAANWGATLQLFGALIDLPSDMLSIGSRLEPFIDQILELLEHSTPRTLLHGDFKVSNIFISSKSKQAPHHPPKDPSISCASCTSLDSPPSIGPQPADDDDDDDSLPVKPVKPKQVLSASHQVHNKKSGKKSAKLPSVPASEPASQLASSALKTESLEDSSRLYVIDWQWFGCGLAATDVAHFIWTSVDSETLSSESQLHHLLHHYHQFVKRAGAKDYAFKQFYRHFQLATLDYFVYMCSKWAVSSPQEFVQLAKQNKNGLTSRSLFHMHALIKASCTYFPQIFGPSILIDSL